MPFRVTNTTRGEVLADRSDRAASFFTRGIGLMGRKGLPAAGGLIIQPCSSVITFFMRFPIDVLFVDRDGLICHAIKAMPPWRTSKIVRQSKLVIELPAGTLTRSGTEVGDSVAIESA